MRLDEIHPGTCELSGQCRRGNGECAMSKATRADARAAGRGKRLRHVRSIKPKSPSAKTVKPVA